MKQLLAGYTHVIVRTVAKEKATETGVYAYVDICFGPGDSNAIANIPWRKVEGQMAFSSPRTSVIGPEGKEIKPVFKGKLNEELCNLCAQKVFQIRKQMGHVRAGKTYRVDDKGVQEILTPEGEVCPPLQKSTTS